MIVIIFTPINKSNNKNLDTPGENYSVLRDDEHKYFF